MRIQTLLINNFRAITHLELRDLKDTVVVAGPNGCGKSCVYDAIRWLKSLYGGYQQNEWHQFFGEFQFNFQQKDRDWLALLQNRSIPLSITAEIVLSEDERSYLQDHVHELLKEQIWKEVVPELAAWRYFGTTPMAANLRVHEPEVKKRVDVTLPRVLDELAMPVHTGNLTITPDGEIRYAESVLLELVFSHYDPQNIGIIDYHGATRNYAREQIGGINLNIESTEDKLRQHALYNSAGKYANVKTEMASSYIRHLLTKEAEGTAVADASLGNTLKELFATFFPGKEFLGPRPTKRGGLDFPVRTPSGAQHDIDELSSGEKEVLYG